MLVRARARVSAPYPTRANNLAPQTFSGTEREPLLFLHPHQLVNRGGTVGTPQHPRHERAARRRSDAALVVGKPDILWAPPFGTEAGYDEGTETVLLHIGQPPQLPILTVGRSRAHVVLCLMRGFIRRRRR